MSVDRYNLAGKVALVTGGAQGLGEAIVRELRGAAMRVVMADIKTDTATHWAKELGNQDEIMVRGIDVRHEKEVADCFLHIRETWGKVDVLINNAGTDVTKPVTEMTVAEFDRVVGVNLRGAFLMAQAYLQQEPTRGAIVNIVSTAAKRAWPNASSYHASKWGLLGLSHALFTEAREAQVKVTALVAGGMRTPFITDRFPDTDMSVLQDPAHVAAAVRWVLEQPAETVIPELMVMPLKETSWP
jgi:NADP-dependent 3-hydroxy acid dehydrogenase YdfG